MGVGRLSYPIHSGPPRPHPLRVLAPFATIHPRRSFSPFPPSIFLPFRLLLPASRSPSLSFTLSDISFYFGRRTRADAVSFLVYARVYSCARTTEEIVLVPQLSYVRIARLAAAEPLPRTFEKSGRACRDASSSELGVPAAPVRVIKASLVRVGVPSRPSVPELRAVPISIPGIMPPRIKLHYRVDHFASDSIGHRRACIPFKRG